MHEAFGNTRTRARIHTCFYMYLLVAERAFGSHTASANQPSDVAIIKYSDNSKNIPFALTMPTVSVRTCFFCFVM